MLITAARLLDDTSTTTTSGLTAATDFSVSAFRGSRVGNTIEVHCHLARTGATIAHSSGNISPDVDLATLPSGWRPTTGTTLGFWDSGTECGGVSISTAGLIQIRTSSSDIGTGANIRVQATWIVE
jgi:hypothetical protein